MNLKRLFIVASLAAALAACAQSTPTPTPTVPVESVPVDVTPGVVNPPEEWAHYPLGTFADIEAYGEQWVAEHEAQMLEAAGVESGPYTFDPGEGDDSLIRAPVRYTGECRDISEEHILAMTWWVGQTKPELRDLFLESFKRECRYTDADNSELEYWLPTQEVIIEDQEAGGLLIGQLISVYVQYLGAIVPESGEPEPLYIVNYYWIEPNN